MGLGWAWCSADSSIGVQMTLLEVLRRENEALEAEIVQLKKLKERYGRQLRRIYDLCRLPSTFVYACRCDKCGRKFDTPDQAYDHEDSKLARIKCS